MDSNVQEKKNERNVEDEIVTPQQYLDRELEMEREAREVLPGNFSKCTYNEGPLNQSIFVCLTCKNDKESEPQSAGICYSCSISCHSEHDLLELFVKRDFTCECGTKKFPFKCTLEKGIANPSSSSNIDQPVDSSGWRKNIDTNKYNHNFEGLYCWCNQKYDPTSENDDMYECISCQDWYHKRCMGIKAINENDDFICCTCVEKFPVILSYTRTRKICTHPKVNPIPLKEGSTTANEVFENGKKSDLDKAAEAETAQSPYGLLSPAKNILKRGRDSGETTPFGEALKCGNFDFIDKNSDESVESGNKAPKLTSPSQGSCKRPVVLDELNGKQQNLIGKEGWRDVLCRCEECFSIYSEQGMLHIINPEEVYVPEEEEEDISLYDAHLGLFRTVDETIYDAGMKALNEMPRPQAIEFASKVGSIREKIREFITPFAESGRVVTKEDVEKFFGTLPPR